MSHPASSDSLPPVSGLTSSRSLSMDKLPPSLLPSSASSNSLRAPPLALSKQLSVLHNAQGGITVDTLSAEDTRVVEDFRKRVSSNPSVAIAVCAIQTLTEVVRRSSSSTMMGLEIELNQAVRALKACNPASISLAAGCELFSRYVTRASLDIPRFDECVARLLERGEQFSLQSSNSRLTIASLVDRFISDGKVVFTHGFSRVVQSVLIHAAHAGKNFSVMVTEGRPNCDGYHAAAELIKAGIPVTLVLDSAMAYSMDQADLVLVGAEGVAESGGIINKIGTFQMCVCANALKKPVYVAAESYKFARLFPLNQSDLPETKEQQPPFRPAVVTANPLSSSIGAAASAASSPASATTVAHAANALAAPAGSSTTAPPAAVSASADLLFNPVTSKQYADKITMLNPSCDYTPPEFLTLLFTDIGILTPSAVSDELIKLYY